MDLETRWLCIVLNPSYNGYGSLHGLKRDLINNLVSIPNTRMEGGEDQNGILEKLKLKRSTRLTAEEKLHC